MHLDCLILMLSWTTYHLKISDFVIDLFIMALNDYKNFVISILLLILLSAGCHFPNDLLIALC